MHTSMHDKIIKQNSLNSTPLFCMWSLHHKLHGHKYYHLGMQWRYALHLQVRSESNSQGSAADSSLALEVVLVDTVHAKSVQIRKVACWQTFTMRGYVSRAATFQLLTKRVVTWEHCSWQLWFYCLTSRTSNSFCLDLNQFDWQQQIETGKTFSARQEPTIIIFINDPHMLLHATMQWYLEKMSKGGCIT